MLTQERLKEVLKYDQATGVFTWLVSPNRRIVIGRVAGTITLGYSIINVYGKRMRAHRLAWLYVYGYLPEYDIDHIDRNKLNNRISNLREVTRSCNLRNTGLTEANTSGVRGVCFNETTRKWEAHISINTKHIYTGSSKDFTEAVCHRLAAEQAEDWAGCDSSSTAYQYINKYQRKQIMEVE